MFLLRGASDRKHCGVVPTFTPLLFSSFHGTTAPPRALGVSLSVLWPFSLSRSYNRILKLMAEQSVFLSMHLLHPDIGFCGTVQTISVHTIASPVVSVCGVLKGKVYVMHNWNSNGYLEVIYFLERSKILHNILNTSINRFHILLLYGKIYGVLVFYVVLGLFIIRNKQKHDTNILLSYPIVKFDHCFPSLM